jgi:hypothetical protein
MPYLLELDRTPFEQLILSAVSVQFSEAVRSDQYSLQASFALGQESAGFDPRTEELQITFGANVLTIPAGAMARKGAADFSFAGNLGTTQVKVALSQLSDSAFSIRMQASRLDLSGTSNLVAIRLIAGRNTGQGSLRLSGKLGFGT